MKELADALENLLGFVHLSTDTMVSDCLYRSPAEEMRRAASRMEAQDQAVRWAREALAKYREQSSQDTAQPKVPGRPCEHGIPLAEHCWICDGSREGHMEGDGRADR